MAANVQPIFAASPRNENTTLLTQFGSLSDGSDSVLLFTAGTNGSRLHALLATYTSTEPVAKVLRVWLEKGGTKKLLHSLAVSPFTKTVDAAFPSINLLDPSVLYWLDGADPALTLAQGDSIYVSVETQPNSAIHVHALGGDY
jgi:hypothetical protein